MDVLCICAVWRGCYELHVAVKHFEMWLVFAFLKNVTSAAILKSL